MRKTYMYRLYPTKKQLKTLETTLEECRWLYNNTLAYRKDAWEQEQRNVSYYESKARIPLLKNERLSLKGVHSQVLQNVTERVELAMQVFFRRCKAGEKPGYPRFKGYDRYDSFTYTQAGWRLKDGRLDLTGVGAIKVKWSRDIQGTVKTVTITPDAGQWYVIFSCVVEMGQP